MNFFESQLRRLFGDTEDARFIGRCCFIPADDGNLVKAEFVTQGVHEEYVALQMSVIKDALGRYNPLASGNNVLLNLLIIICLGYCVIKVFFSNIKRGGILLTQIAVGSLHMFSLPRGYSEGFTSWCKQVIAICFTTFMQTTLAFLEICNGTLV